MVSIDVQGIKSVVTRNLIIPSAGREFITIKITDEDGTNITLYPETMDALLALRKEVNKAITMKKKNIIRANDRKLQEVAE